MRTLLALLLMGGVAAAQPGAKPRRGVRDYAVHSERRTVAVGAALLSPDEVRASFVSDLNRSYIVVEVGIFPKGETEVRLADFDLVIAGTATVLRPLSPKTIAGVLQKSAQRGRDVALYPTVGVGHSSGPGYGGWGTGVGLGVGVGNADRPASTDQDRQTMEIELGEKALPEGRTAKPVAGYLYFAVPAKGKNYSCDLEYSVRGETFLLPLGAVKRNR